VSVKRPHYFNHQFLREQDFLAEQSYHVEMRRRHNRLLHGWGVVEGLEVRRRAECEITVEPGMAIDDQGRELVIASPVVHDLSSFDRSSHTFITLVYAEAWQEEDHHSSGGVDGYTRVTERPEVVARKHEPPKDGAVITLARVHLNENGHIGAIDNGLRNSAKTRATGWVRLPFKPVRLGVLAVAGRLVPQKQWEEGVEFTVDISSAYCEKSARGTMGIPVPPGASRVTALRLCGSTRGKVEVELVRSGWNEEQHKGEHKVLTRRTFSARPDRDWFDEHNDVEEEFQALNDAHALALSVIADGNTQVWLVAVRFE
jgi:hypothetical protein